MVEKLRGAGGGGTAGRAGGEFLRFVGTKRGDVTRCECLGNAASLSSSCVSQRELQSRSDVGVDWRMRLRAFARTPVPPPGLGMPLTRRWQRAPFRSKYLSFNTTGRPPRRHSELRALLSDTPLANRESRDMTSHHTKNTQLTKILPPRIQRIHIDTSDILKSLIVSTI